MNLLSVGTRVQKLQRVIAMYRLTILFSCVVSTSLAFEEEKKAEETKAEEKITFQDHVLPIFRAKCASCHSADSAKGGLVVDNYSALMQGGASGEVVVGGDVDGSRLWELVSHASEPFMPPKEPKLPDDQLNLIRKWIELGALENSGSKAKIKKTQVLTATTITTGRPEGPPPMPEGLTTVPVTASPRGNVATAIATSPWAPLLAVAGHKQIILYHTGELRVIGILPFPEGQAQVLKFSRNGSLLLAGGGRAGQSGKVIVWDVKTGQRVFEIGDEYDTVLAADISADHSQIALGGPRKVVRVYSTKDGELMYEIKKHTDWITAIEFSPDGVLLATGDRSNGLFVWEGFTGREFYVLNAHASAITSLSWRSDANILASCSEDTTIRLWEMQNGSHVRGWGVHGGGVSAIQFTRDGRIVSTGRDNVTKIWDQNGQAQRGYPAHADVALEVAHCSETDRVFAGDWTGTIRAWNTADGAELTALSTNPPSLSAQVESAKTTMQQAVAGLEAAEKELAALVLQETERQKPVELAKGTLAEKENGLSLLQESTKDAEKLKVSAENQVLVSTELVKTGDELLAFSKKNLARAEKRLAEATEAGKAEAEKDVTLWKKQVEDNEISLNKAKAALANDEKTKSIVGETLTSLAKKIEEQTTTITTAKTELEKAIEAAKPTPEQMKAKSDSEAKVNGTKERIKSLEFLLKKLTEMPGVASN